MIKVHSGILFVLIKTSQRIRDCSTDKDITYRYYYAKLNTFFLCSLSERMCQVNLPLKAMKTSISWNEMISTSRWTKCRGQWRKFGFYHIFFSVVVPSMWVAKINVHCYQFLVNWKWRSVDETLESCWAVLSCGTVYYTVLVRWFQLLSLWMKP